MQQADDSARSGTDNGGMDIRLRFNGENRSLPEGATVADLLQAEQLATRRVAVELNGEIVPRSIHGTRVLASGDVVEVVHALGGG